MARVVSGFKCPYTKRIYHVGDEYDGEHLVEYAAKGYIDAADATVPNPDGEADEPKGAPAESKPRKSKG